MDSDENTTERSANTWRCKDISYVNILGVIFGLLFAYYGYCYLFVTDYVDQEITLYKNNVYVTVLPSEIHNDALNIYNQIPGTFMKYLKSTSTVENLEYSEHDFTITMSRRDCRDLHDYLQKSLENNFLNDKVTELNANKLAEKIVETCSQKYANWDEDVPLVAMFDINIHYLQKSNSGNTTYIHVYTYVVLSVECQTLSFRSTDQYKCIVSYDLTIKFNKVVMDSQKISQLGKMIAENNMAKTMIEMKKDSPITWDDLDVPSSETDTQTKPPLSWDDL